MYMAGRRITKRGCVCMQISLQAHWRHDKTNVELDIFIRRLLNLVLLWHNNNLVYYSVFLYLPCYGSIPHALYVHTANTFVCTWDEFTITFFIWSQTLFKFAAIQWRRAGWPV